MCRLCDKLAMFFEVNRIKVHYVLIYALDFNVISNNFF
jgi:hypothetical protein